VVNNLEKIAVYLNCATFQEDEVRIFESQNSIWMVDVLLTTLLVVLYYMTSCPLSRFDNPPRASPPLEDMFIGDQEI
jgi:hypothetical protein